MGKCMFDVEEHNQLFLYAKPNEADKEMVMTVERENNRSLTQNKYRVVAQPINGYQSSRQYHPPLL